MSFCSKISTDIMLPEYLKDEFIRLLADQISDIPITTGISENTDILNNINKNFIAFLEEDES